MAKTSKVLTGLDVLREERFEILRGRRVGLVANAASVDSELRPIQSLLTSAGIQVTTLFTPEHGFYGTEQDLISVPHDQPGDGVPLVSLYGSTVESLKPTTERLRSVDVLLIDLPDIGSRYYTFASTMLYCLRAAAECRVPLVIIDRPNPLGGRVEGPLIQPGFESFVGMQSVCIRHGMKMGELARLYVHEQKIAVDVTVVNCENWKRKTMFQTTGLPWVMPSPNMPTFDTALVYPGQCLLEGTNLSEGRGTTRPFEICGAPWINPAKLITRLEAHECPGVRFRPLYFRPTFQKHAGQLCGGVQLHVTDPPEFRPVWTGLVLLHAMRLESGMLFRWRTEPYEFVADRPAIDLLFGSDRERLALERGDCPEVIAKAWEPEVKAFMRRCKPWLSY